MQARALVLRLGVQQRRAVQVGAVRRPVQRQRWSVHGLAHEALTRPAPLRARRRGASTPALVQRDARPELWPWFPEAVLPRAWSALHWVLLAGPRLPHLACGKALRLGTGSAARPQPVWRVLPPRPAFLLRVGRAHGWPTQLTAAAQPRAMMWSATYVWPSLSGVTD